MQLLGWTGSLSLDKAVVVVATDRTSARSALASARGAVLFMHLPVGVAGILVGGWLFANPAYSVLLLVGAWVTSHGELVAGWLLATGKEDRFALLRLAQPLMYLLFCVVIGAAGTVMDLDGVTIWLAGAAVASLLFPLLLGPWSPTVRHPPGRLALVRIGASALAATTFQYLNSRLDILVLSTSAAPRVVGVYAMGMALGRAPLFLAAAGATRGLTGRGPFVDTKALFTITSLGIAVAAVAPLVLPLVLGPAFHRSILVAQILALGTPVDYLQQSWSGRLLRLQRMPALVFAQVMGSVLFLAGILVSQLDWWVATVSVASYSLSALILGLALWRTAAAQGRE